MAPRLDAARERILLSAARMGDGRAAAELVRSHMPLVLRMALRYRHGNVSRRDLVSEGVLGLIEAIRRFDITQEVRFAAYATWWIRASISQYALTNGRLVRLPSSRNARTVARKLRCAEHLLSQRLGGAPTRDQLAQVLEVGVADVAEVQAALGSTDISLTPVGGYSVIQPISETEGPEQALERLEEETARRRCVGQALAGLSARERSLIHELYLSEQGRSLSELGKEFGVSRQRMGQLLSVARKKLKRELSLVV
jgi:RNA polymerase sigma-32 factor